MERLTSAKHPLLLVLWLGLFLAGCMTQIGVIPGPGAGMGNGELVISRLTKIQAHGNGTWSRNGDGSTAIRLQLAPLRSALDSAKGFRVQAVELSKITGIQAQITAADIGTPIVPTGATATGSLAVTNGVIPPLTFPTVPAGTKRVLTVTGYDAGGGTVTGIRSLFDLAGSSGGFEVSPRTTPAATVYESLASTNPTAAASLATADLNTFVDQVTGVPGGSTYPHTYTTHPGLVDTVGLVADLGSNGGTTGGLTASTYSLSGAQVQLAFWLPPEPATADLPTLYVDDTSSQPFTVPLHSVGDAAIGPINVGASLSYSINSDNRVTVTFHSVAPHPTAGGGNWKVGAFVSGDGTSPNPRYYDFGGNAAGFAQTVFVSVSDAKRLNPTLQPFTGREPVEPHYVAGKLRWFDTSASQVQTYDATTFPSAVIGMGSSSSTEFKVYAGPSTAGYTFASNLILPSNKAVELLGPDYLSAPTDPRKDPRRPVLRCPGSPGTVYLNHSSQVLRDLRLQDTTIQLGAGATLERLTVNGISASSGALAAIRFEPGGAAGTASLSNLHLYDIAHNGSSTGDSLAAIHIGGPGAAVIANVLIDDQDDAGFPASSVRHQNGGPEATIGILVDSSGPVSINQCEVKQLNGGVGTYAAQTFGIRHIGSDPQDHVVQNCTVASLFAHEITGIAVSMGTVSNCQISNLNHLAGGERIWAIEAGSISSTQAIHVFNNTLTNLGSTLPTANTILEGIHVNLPGASTTISDNTISNNQSLVFEGIVLSDGNGSTTEQTVVANNVITSNRNVNDTNGRFTGINLANPGQAGSLTIKDNDISSNLMYQSARGIRTQLSQGNTVVQHNRLSGNTLNHATGATDLVLIHIEETGSATAKAEGNILTGNTLQDNTGVPNTGSFTGLWAVGSTTTTMDLINNSIHSNSVTFGSGDTGSVVLLRNDSSGTTISNRVYANTYTGTNLANATPTALRHWLSASGQTAHIDHNLVAEPGLGTAFGHQPINVSATSGATLTLTSNTVYVGGGNSPGIVWDPGEGTFEARDNVLIAGASGSASAVIVQVGISGSATVTHNTKYNFASHWSGNASPSLTGSTNLVSWPFTQLTEPPSNTDVIANHGMDLESTLQGAFGYGSDGSTQRGINGGSAGAPYVLSPEPTWP